jgi:O-antigen ligase
VGVAVHKQNLSPQNRPVIRLVAPGYIEYGFYACLVYGLMAPVLGLQIDRLGIVFLAGLACLCFLVLRERSIGFFRTLVFPIGLGISYLIIQLMYHGVSIQHAYVKPFIPWILTLIVVQALSFRTGFSHRFVIFSLLMGCMMLFFIDFRGEGEEVTRMGLDKLAVGGMSNPNALGAWFGFCAVYLFVLGLVTKWQKTRIVSWIIAIGCLLIVTLTVSRTALLATIIAIVVGSRGFLKGGFLPLLLLLVLAWITYGVGLFDQTINYYLTRGTEESGRFLIWPRALEGFMDAPLVGVGAEDVYIFIPEMGKYATPHNGFLLIAMASGILPLIFYAAYWVQASWSAIKSRAGTTDTAAFLLPMVVFAFLTCFSGNLNFMGPYVTVTLAAALTSSIPKRVINSKIIGAQKIHK